MSTRLTVGEYPEHLRPTRWRCPHTGCGQPATHVLTGDDGQVRYECSAGHKVPPLAMDFRGK